MTNDASNDRAARDDGPTGGTLPDLRADSAARTTREANADDPSRSPAGSTPASDVTPTETDRRHEAELLGE